MNAISEGGAHSDALAYSINDAARIIGVSRSSIYELFKLGELAYVKLGKRRLVEHVELQRLLAAHRIGG